MARSRTAIDNKTIVEYCHEASQEKIADIANTEIGYQETKGAAGSFYQLRISGADYELGAPNGGGQDVGFATLVWVPSNNVGVGTEANGWTTYDHIQTGQWWSTRNLSGGIKRGETFTLEEFAAKQPNAVLDHYGVNLGSGATAGTNHVDNITLGCTTTNFDLTAPSGSNGSLGDLFTFGS